MATESSLGRRRAMATQRIEAALNNVGHEGVFVLPTFSRHGQGVLLVKQLESIADWLDGGAAQAVSVPMVQVEPVETPESVTTVTHVADGETMIIDLAEPEPPTESDETAEDEQYGGMSNAQLEELILERGLVKGKARSKAELIAVLETADEENT